jgi:hypothetical protein
MTVKGSEGSDSIRFLFRKVVQACFSFLNRKRSSTSIILVDRPER